MIFFRFFFHFWDCRLCIYWFVYPMFKLWMLKLQSIVRAISLLCYHLLGNNSILICDGAAVMVPANVDSIILNHFFLAFDLIFVFVAFIPIFCSFQLVLTHIAILILCARRILNVSTSLSLCNNKDYCHYLTAVQYYFWLFFFPM